MRVTAQEIMDRQAPPEAVRRFQDTVRQMQETLAYLEQLEAQSGGQNAPRTLSLMTGAMWAAVNTIKNT